MDLSFEVVLHCLVIVVARIADVSLATLRTVAIVHGRRGPAFFLGFAEILIWIAVVSDVVNRGLGQPAFALSYALGFALGTYAGITLEGWFAAGEQVLRVFTRKAQEIAAELRSRGQAVTEFEGSGLAGPVSMLFLSGPRRQMPEVIRYVNRRDPKCFYLLDDVRRTSPPKVRLPRSIGWWSLFKKK